MTRADELNNSCELIPGAPTGPRYQPREQIFCQDVTVKQDLKVEGKAEIQGRLSTDSNSITINGKEFVPAVIQNPGPLASVVMTGPGGELIQFLPGTTILVSIAPPGFVPSALG